MKRNIIMIIITVIIMILFVVGVWRMDLSLILSASILSVATIWIFKEGDNGEQ